MSKIIKEKIDENIRVRRSLKQAFEVESAGRRMNSGDFADYVWQIYLEHRPDMVVQHPDGRIELMPIKRNADPDLHEIAELLRNPDSQPIRTALREFLSSYRTLRKQNSKRNPTENNGEMTA